MLEAQNYGEDDYELDGVPLWRDLLDGVDGIELGRDNTIVEEEGRK